MAQVLLLPVALLLLQRAALGAVVLPNPNLQYHIQTDQGEDRFFRFQTESGQYRKEHRRPDGSVVGSYGWVDPNGVFRLFDYISDDQGYRIKQSRLFKVGKPVANGFVLDTRGGDLNLGFEVFPLDLNSDPAFNGIAQATHSVPLGGTGGFKALHGPEGSFHLTPSFQVASLSSNGALSNPVSKQEQATFYGADPLLVPLQPPPPPPPPRKPIVIGARYKKKESPPPPPTPPFVIGAAANEKTRPESIRRQQLVIGQTRSGATVTRPL